MRMIRKLSLAIFALALMVGTAGIAAAQNYGYDRDGYYDRDGDRDFHRGTQVARSIGFEDGEQTAREDMWHGKPFNPYPRGHNHADRGYARDFGSIQEYRENYSEAYREGYSSVFHRDRYYR